MIFNIGIVGIGFVGNAIKESLCKNNYVLDKNLKIYDKFKDGGINSLEYLLDCDILFLCLPTIYLEDLFKYDYSPIEEILYNLSNYKYNGIILIKSTIEPLIIDKFSIKYNLDLIHNPEFLTARTANDDFHNQKHVVIGLSYNLNQTNHKVISITNFYKQNYPNALLSICSSNESSTMKLFLNSFYAIKVQTFTELYLLCQKIDVNYDSVKQLMLNNNWINPMHTNVPGPDSQISYGGLCFPKDTNALNTFMKAHDVPNAVLDATIHERNTMRDDNLNCSKSISNL